MFSSVHMGKYLRRLQRSARGTMLGEYPFLFYGAVFVFLAFFAVGAVHELIPGLCEAEEEGEEDCPFCQLVHSCALFAVAVICARIWAAVLEYLPYEPVQQPLRVRFPHFLLRAPPAA